MAKSIHTSNKSDSEMMFLAAIVLTMLSMSILFVFNKNNHEQPNNQTRVEGVYTVSDDPNNWSEQIKDISNNKTGAEFERLRQDINGL